MRFAQRKIAECKSELAHEALLQFLHDRIGHSAVRAFVIPEFDQRRMSIARAVDMIALAHVGCQPGVAHRPFPSDAAPLDAVSDSSAWRIPSAPGFTPVGER